MILQVIDAHGNKNVWVTDVVITESLEGRLTVFDADESGDILAEFNNWTSWRRYSGSETSQTQ